MDPTLFRTLTAWSFSLLLLYVLGAIAAPFATAFVLSAAIAVPTYPVHARVERLLNGRKGTAAALSVLLLAVVVVVPVTGLLSLLAVEGAKGYRFLEDAAASGRIPGTDEVLGHPYVAPAAARVQHLLDTLGVDVKATLLPAAKEGLGLLVAFASGALKNVFLFSVELLLMLVVLFFLYRDGAALADTVWEFVPLPPDEKALLKGNLARTTSSVMVGIVGTSLLQGLLGGFSFWVAGLPSPVLFGAVMAFASMIPVVGTALVWIPGAAYLFATGSTWQGVFLCAWGLAVVGTADNVVRPLLMSGSAGLSLPLVAIGALGGFAAFGVAGVVVGPLAVSLAVTLLEVVRARREREGGNGIGEGAAGGGSAAEEGGRSAGPGGDPAGGGPVSPGARGGPSPSEEGAAPSGNEPGGHRRVSNP
jgi:predicted PurR-regulated permease PerM